jgi:3-oxoacyl-[acyl-carrier-protein] synthase II
VNRRRTLVTGVAVISPVGEAPGRYWQSMLYGHSAPQDHATLPPALLQNQRYYRIDDHAPADDVPTGQSRATRLAIKATATALADAGLKPEDLSRTTVGVCFGTGMGEGDRVERGHVYPATAPDAAASYFHSSIAAHVAAAHGLRGPNTTLSTACSAGSYAVALAHDRIASGEAELMVAGGSEIYSRVGQGCFHRLGALDPVACRPFDAQRKGTVFGEGVAALVLESADHAMARGWRALAAVEGAGWSCDGFHVTAPESSGRWIEAAIRGALSEAALTPQDIDCVLPHGTGTSLNDVVESQVLERVFDGRLRDLKISAIKSKLGHSGGAAGAVACATAAMILDTGAVPPTGNVDAIDAQCRLPIHVDAPATATIRHVLVNAYAFGGNNISVVLGKP